VFKGTSKVKTLFAQYDGLVLPPLNDMELPAHILNGRKEDVAIKTLNPLMEGESISMFQEEGVRNFTPLTNSTKGPNKCTNNNL
jgi:hypothetical protein